MGTLKDLVAMASSPGGVLGALTTRMLKKFEKGPMKVI